MTYLYETIPSKEGETVQQFEIQQSMNDMPLTQHPETGVPIRRVILGGWGAVTANSPATAQSSCCKPGSGCC